MMEEAKAKIEKLKKKNRKRSIFVPRKQKKKTANMNVAKKKRPVYTGRYMGQ